MCRYGHHGAFAVAHQHVVGDPHREEFAAQRMDHAQARRHSLLFHGGKVGLGNPAAFAFVDECGQCRVVPGRKRRQRMFGRHGHVGRAHERVGTGGEDLEHSRLADGGQVVGEMDLHALGASDPVPLHGLDLFGPVRHPVERIEKLIRIGGDSHVVHRDLALLDEGAAAPAAPVDDLLVGEHRLVNRIPVHGAEFLVDQSLSVQAGEQPLLPAVVVGLAGGEFARPVDRKPETPQLRLHVFDVGVGPPGRGDVILDRRILCRHAERVPAHRLQHVAPAHAMVAGQYVADGVVAHVPHVQLSRRVGKHAEAVILGLAGVFGDAESLRTVPVLLCCDFDLGGTVFFLHGGRLPWECDKRKIIL